MRIHEVGAGARAHPWGGVSPFKMHYLTAFEHQSITGRPPLGEILYPPLAMSPVAPTVPTPMASPKGKSLGAVAAPGGGD